MSSRISHLTAAFVFIMALTGSLRAQSVNDFLSASTEVYYNSLLDGMLSYLTPQQRAEFETALYPALAKNPDLVTDGAELLKEGGKQFDPSAPGGADAYLGKMRDYEARLRTAMTAEDADIGKIFDQIDAHLPHPAHP